MAEDKESKTEEPTSRRLSKAREEGQVAKSMEVNTFAVLMAGLIALFLAAPHMYHQLTDIMVKTFSNAGHMDIDGPNLTAFLVGRLKQAAIIILPVVLSIAAVGVLANYFQVGAMFTTKPLEPKLSKLNPIKGLTKFFSKRALMDLFKSVGKLVIVGSIAYLTVKSDMDTVMVLSDMEPREIGLFVLLLAFKIFLFTCWVLAVLAVIDFIFQKWQHHQEMKMTKQEVKEDHKQAEGDPIVKSRIRAAQREAAKKRMLQNVPQADVVVTNPIHLAVALLYDPEKSDAPLVVAKGQALIAEKIKEIAREHNVPVMEDKPLAQALYKMVEVGETIPYALYQAVAEILAYVYQLKGQKVHG